MTEFLVDGDDEDSNYVLPPLKRVLPPPSSSLWFNPKRPSQLQESSSKLSSNTDSTNDIRMDDRHNHHGHSLSSQTGDVGKFPKAPRQGKDQVPTLVLPKDCEGKSRRIADVVTTAKGTIDDIDMNDGSDFVTSVNMEETRKGEGLHNHDSLAVASFDMEDVIDINDYDYRLNFDSNCSSGVLAEDNTFLDGKPQCDDSEKKEDAGSPTTQFGSSYRLITPSSSLGSVSRRKTTNTATVPANGVAVHSSDDMLPLEVDFGITVGKKDEEKRCQPFQPQPNFGPQQVPFGNHVSTSGNYHYCGASPTSMITFQQEQHRQWLLSQHAWQQSEQLQQLHQQQKNQRIYGPAYDGSSMFHFGPDPCMPGWNSPLPPSNPFMPGRNFPPSPYWKGGVMFQTINVPTAFNVAAPGTVNAGSANPAKKMARLLTTPSPPLPSKKINKATPTKTKRSVATATKCVGTNATASSNVKKIIVTTATTRAGTNAAASSSNVKKKVVTTTRPTNKPSATVSKQAKSRNIQRPGATTTTIAGTNTASSNVTPSAPVSKRPKLQNGQRPKKATITTVLVGTDSPPKGVLLDGPNRNWPEGWISEDYQSSKSPRIYRYFVSPKDKIKLRSLVEVQFFLEAMEEIDDVHTEREAYRYMKDEMHKKRQIRKGTDPNVGTKKKKMDTKIQRKENGPKNTLKKKKTNNNKEMKKMSTAAAAAVV